jgi:hypothetical protein
MKSGLLGKSNHFIPIYLKGNNDVPFEPTLYCVDVILLFFLIACLFLMGVWLGEDQTTNIKTHV